MKGTILERILESKRRRVESAKAAVDRAELIERARSVHDSAPPHRFRSVVEDRSRINIVAEFKRASPSKGAIRANADPAATAKDYAASGAIAVSVLTEEDHFAGSLEDLRAVREAVDLPILRKDFIFDPFQVYEAAASGADAILLIVAMLDDSQLQDLEALAEDELGMDALIEVHTPEEMLRIKNSGAKLIGVNNRNLRSFEVSLDVSRELFALAPRGSLLIAESGLRTAEDLSELREIGYAGFLIGETLMKSEDPAGDLRRLLGKG